MATAGSNNNIGNTTSINTITGATNNIVGTTNINTTSAVGTLTTIGNAANGVGDQALQVNGAMSSTGNATIATAADTTNTFGSGADSNNTIGNAGTSVNTIQGETNTIRGDTNTISGQYNTISGEYNTIRGYSNTIEGNTNTITGRTSTDISGNNAYVDLSNNTASMGVTGGSIITATNTQVTALTADGSGLTINNGVTAPGATQVTLLNSTGHGLTINTDSTVLSGGTHSTSMTLNDWGATFSNNGSPARVTGVADGVNQYDAVNFGQLQKSYIGIASVSALAAIPGTIPGKNFAIGAGYGYFENESALAIGLKASILNCLSVQAGVGFGVGQANSDYSANAGISFSF